MVSVAPDVPYGDAFSTDVDWEVTEVGEKQVRVSLLLTYVYMYICMYVCLFV